MRKIFSVLVGVFFLGTTVFAASNATYGPTKSSEHLWRIALKVRPNKSVTAQQVMLAILYYNEDAFSSENINALVPGSILAIPDIEKIRAVASAEEAVREVGEQNTEWLGGNFKATKKSHKKIKPRVVNDVQPQTLPEAVTDPYASSSTPAHAVAAPVKNLPAQNVAEKVANQTQEHANIVSTNIKSIEENIAIQDLNNRLTVDEAKYNILQNMVQTQSNQVSARIGVLEQDLKLFKKREQEREKGFLNKILLRFDTVESRLGRSVFIFLIVLIIVALFLIVRLMFPRRNNSSVCYPRSDIPKKSDDDFDIFAGKEGNATKLNLARTYINMDKKKEARDLLNEVLSGGNSSEQNEAHLLLEKIK